MIFRRSSLLISSVRIGFLLAGIAIASLAWAADSGSIRVRVLNTDAKPVKNALVTLYRGKSEAVIAEARTDEEGVTELKDLAPASDYQVKVTGTPDDVVVVQPEIVVRAGHRYPLAITLHRKNEPRIPVR